MGATQLPACLAGVTWGGHSNIFVCPATPQLASSVSFFWGQVWAPYFLVGSVCTDG